ncbi:hypothetical protein DEIPH_ctg027orf0037 [Deinococcus phoenicis]|uniref:Uncharacterized protein n=1 Tax=Deinococcus phoenicis TaxID=1476583 RepID=A0A016QQ63_9DEIO|nr:hypothetical protein [Deinococcus phoenicis]EYB68101.1 hypothetical protein DEIPH_ctg027orf0037 [Deinococcus phoenicis]
MKHTRTWTDVYGSALAGFEGRAGGHRWLVAAPPELAADVPSQLAALDGKGRVDLLVHDGVTPLLAALHDRAPRGVLVVAPRALPSGPAVTVPECRVEDAGGAEYREGGAFPAWQGVLGAQGEPGANEAASAAASLGVPVAVTTPDGVRAALEAWMDSTPHGR